MELEEPRNLRGHKSTATSCIASRDQPGLVVTSGEDGCVCWFDLRCKDVQFTMDVGTEPVSSLCFKTVGGHNAAVSCVAFSMFLGKGRFLISGGNDKTIKFWDCFKCLDPDNTNNNRDFLHLNINLSKKVNWLCTNQSDSENLVVCDTTKVVKLYSIA